MKPHQFTLEVWGELAVFTQPALKVERYSYPIITPSAARGIFDSIYLKRTKFRWQITKIETLEFPKYIALRRNEVKNKAPGADTIARWMQGTEEPVPLWADGDGETTGKDKGRTQRQTMALKNVRYRLSAEIRPWEEFRSEQKSFEGQFERHVNAGQCIVQPCFGCREFPCFFEMALPDSKPVAPVNMALGWMLYDVFDLSRPGRNTDAPFITLFEANIENGILQVPDFSSPDVRKPRREVANA